MKEKMSTAIMMMIFPLRLINDHLAGTTYGTMMPLPDYHRRRLSGILRIYLQYLLC